MKDLAMGVRVFCLFVRLIDNYGDVGVAWRLAQQLHAQFDVAVHLWVDDAVALQTLVPDLLSARPSAPLAGVVVHDWADDAAMRQELAVLPAIGLVIETFGCVLPEPMLARMAIDKPLWLNWEYLSAEDWAVDMHGMPSLQGNGVAKYFWLMGFDQHSGGLLRESAYAAQKNAFLDDVAAQQAFRLRYRLPENPPAQTVLLFAYATPVWAQWLSMWRQARQPLTVWLAGHQVADSLRAAGAIGARDLRAVGDGLQQGCVRLLRIPFVPQAEFDRLLWLADWALVRGEDSFVRAQWSGQPFFWHIYTQPQAAHLPKLHAFWCQATAGWDVAVRQAHQILSDDINGASLLGASERLVAWQCLQQAWPQWRQGAAAWSQALAAQPTAMEKLASFVQDKLK